MNMKLTHIPTAMLVAGALLLGACGDSDSNSTVADGASAADAGAALTAELDAVVDATEKYVDVGVAIDAGYEAASPCVEEGRLGAMGIHYVNFGLVDDPAVDPLVPEVLLYMPVGDELELIGVEWLVVDDDGDLDTDHDRPNLFGRGFDGPMDGHGPGEPVHYDLHAWLFEENPEGTFVPFNPSLSC